MSEPKFKDGMIAWSPRNGFARCSIDNTGDKAYPLIHAGQFFRSNGARAVNDQHPTLLTLEEAAKLGYEMTKEEKKRFGLIKTRMVTVERWVNVYPDGDHSGGFVSRDEADKWMSKNRINCIKTTGSYEEEVEE